ncbi:tRNA (adenosine(37)-N6)-threonylcarbamoyltransferase complex dimerization subunit type 1 TsaB [Deinococcus cellulosilyticus]|uniref:tRNA (Adenosine(37)-N6)-threonylcarbamoyltransferase complex dimerization subunit type 1 TsaB n=1 Tax=Deinococcus cellulosilyticus (strain DSM 18568 / NBRC 106333 / KACC 11606 / 5516J-15) TaxID=1223518 RepID=A0A511N4Z5_DEIC1|nr:tRNA (adenosine(37)-N6)-threonylcarbamoyltransferase complex dimerization subunit type 1 TsaB [Deinococcus cellulosilyticus]GEM47548.1 tRNA (adenosine(37)-N6)-threonylcarbamoyltransferase complex dimerization subunit type 1 TsaB [Deinococcus cellulosilyticus NBRC 106333 = KACC 11606]
MLTLALDTATPDLSLALVTPQGTFSYCERLERLHAQRIALETEQLFSHAGLPFRASRLVVGVGPGSYTGVRVAASYALGLARAWNAEVLGVSTLMAMAAAHEGRVGVTLDARRGNVYAGLYEVKEGQVVSTLIPDGKHPLVDFQAQVEAAGGTLLPNARVTGKMLALLADQHGVRDWKLHYL